MKRIRILLIDDNRLLRDGMKAALNEQPDLRVVAASGGRDGLQQARKATPDVVLMDLGLRDHEGARLIESLKKESPEIKAIGLGLIPSQVDVVELMEAGASGFVLKDATLAELLGAIRTVAAGGKVLPPAFTA